MLPDLEFFTEQYWDQSFVKYLGHQLQTVLYLDRSIKHNALCDVIFSLCLPKIDHILLLVAVLVLSIKTVSKQLFWVSFEFGKNITFQIKTVSVYLNVVFIFLIHHY